MTAPLKKLERYTDRDFAIVDRPKFAGDPVVFLTAFLGMRVDPQRSMIGFTPTDLDYMGDVWEQATIATLGRDDAFKRETEKIRHLSQKLKAEAIERKQNNQTPLTGCVFEAHDWPARATVERAIKALTAAEIRGIH